jgi:hypothetical protein
MAAGTTQDTGPLHAPVLLRLQCTLRNWSIDSAMQRAASENLAFLRPASEIYDPRAAPVPGSRRLPPERKASCPFPNSSPLSFAWFQPGSLKDGSRGFWHTAIPRVRQSAPLHKGDGSSCHFAPTPHCDRGNPPAEGLTEHRSGPGCVRLPLRRGSGVARPALPSVKETNSSQLVSSAPAVFEESPRRGDLGSRLPPSAKLRRLHDVSPGRQIRWSRPSPGHASSFIGSIGVSS